MRKEPVSLFTSVENNGRVVLMPTSAAIVTPTHSASRDTLLKDFYDVGSRGANENKTMQATLGEQWIQATCMVKDNPSLVNRRVFLTAMENHPPAGVVRFMLSVNPDVAGIPEEGPTALQVALNEGASLDVVQVLLEACPFALCVTNPDTGLEPLSYAKRCRSDERDLIELLSRPLGSWLVSLEERKSPDLSNQEYTGASRGRQRRSENMSVTHFKPSSVPWEGFQNKQVGPRSLDEHQELNNLKLLCAQVLRGHKRLAKQVQGCEEEILRHKTERDKMEGIGGLDRAQILADVDQQQRKLFYRQRIALDMKERAFLARVERAEQHCRANLAEEVEGVKSRLTSWQRDAEKQLNEWRVILDHEVKVNAHFRSDVGRFMAEFGEEVVEATSSPSSISSTDCEVAVDSQFLFAPNLDEGDDRTPLVQETKINKRLVQPSMFRWPWSRVARKGDRVEPTLSDANEQFFF